jgi:hypothetical protein
MEACCIYTEAKDRDCSPASVQSVRDVTGPDPIRAPIRTPTP